VRLILRRRTVRNGLTSLEIFGLFFLIRNMDFTLKDHHETVAVVRNALLYGIL
jgi:hypothetical protein